ncbi:MAG: polysaccharide pyruvyl transferase family protein [Selenomonadaceae bacterium]|nr:polysaccharide pyruvyl transferase family protein [Selenomonadaceae bacterium]
MAYFAAKELILLIKTDNKRLKIANLTLDGYFNYGNVLQRYAVCNLLMGLGAEVDSLWFSSQAGFLPYLQSHYPWMKDSWDWKTWVKLGINWKGATSKLLSGREAWEAARNAGIKSFVDRYIPMRYNVDFAKVADKYDYFVTGSDQVWNPNFADLEKLFLKFAPRAKRIAYAASISCPEIPSKDLQGFIDGINGMKAISVREQAGAELIEQLTGRKVEVVADPTMLVAAEKWREIARKPSWLKGDEEILTTYFLGKRPDEVINRLAREHGLKVVNILDEHVFEHYAVAPEEWLWLIDNASLMYTDSFHGTVFSILFRRPFVVAERIEAGCASKMTSRIDTLLGKFGLEARRGTKENGYMIDNPMSMQYGDVEMVLAEERRKADNYLEGALK